MKKKIYIICAVVAVALVGIAAWFCTRGEEDEVAMALPADVTMVARINPQSVVLENGLSLDLLKKALSEENKTGLDLTVNSYAFSSRGYVGAVLAIDDDDDFREFAEKFGCVWENHRGMQWTVINNSFLICLDEDRAMVMGPATGAEQDELHNTMANCMKQKAADSGMKTDEFKALAKREEAIAMVCNLASLPEQGTQTLDAVLPEDVERSDIMLTTGMSIKDNRLMLNVSTTSEKKKARKFIEGLQQVFLPVSDGLQTRANAFATIAFGVNGEKLLEMLRQNPQTRTMLLAANMGMDLDMIIKSLNGDVDIDFPHVMSSKMIMEAQVNNSSFMENVSDWNEDAVGLHVMPFRNDLYLCSFQNMAAYFGVKDNVLTLSNDQHSVLTEGAPRTSLPEMAGKRVYMQVNLHSLNKYIGMLQMIMPGSMVGLLCKMQAVTLSTDDCKEWQLQLVASEGTDILKEILGE